MKRGRMLRAFASRLFDTRMMERVIDPAIADLQRERSLGSYAGALKVFAFCAVQEVTMSAPDWSSEDRRAMARMLVAGGIITLLATMALEQPFIPYLWRRGYDARIPLYLAPQGLPLALAIGVTLGVLFAVDGRETSRRVTGWLLVSAFVASLVSFVDLAWITPAGNQAFRVAASGNPAVARGMPEMTLGELWQMSSSDATFTFHMRIALAFLPLLLAWVMLSIVGMKRASRWIARATPLVAIVGYYVLLFTARSLTLSESLPAVVGAWLPDVVIAMVAAGLIAVRLKADAT